MTAIQLDFSEKGRSRSGEETKLDRRLFMQLHCFTGCRSVKKLIKALSSKNIPGVLYQDLNDPQGVGLLTFHEDPQFFVKQLRQFILRSGFAKLTSKPEMTMIGRSYSIGYEDDLPYVLLQRPKERALNKDLQWAIWYPLRRSGDFENLPGEQQDIILKEHGTIGFAFSAADYGVDIRLACHGLDRNDNDFVIGILGPKLSPLSSLVQRMRKTQQTSKYLESLGPFFVGHVIWQSAG